jgi:hypothetical protein
MRALRWITEELLALPCGATRRAERRARIASRRGQTSTAPGFAADHRGATRATGDERRPNHAPRASRPARQNAVPG